MMEGESRRGISCREWLRDIKEWRGEDILVLNRKAHDRSTWKSVAQTALETGGR